MTAPSKAAPYWLASPAVLPPAPPVALDDGAPHGGPADAETLAASLGSPFTAYRCANKKADGVAVYTNMVPAGGFRGYGASQTTFAMESAMDELARRTGLPVTDPIALGVGPIVDSLLSRDAS